MEEQEGWMKQQGLGHRLHSDFSSVSEILAHFHHSITPHQFFAWMEEQEGLGYRFQLDKGTCL